MSTRAYALRAAERRRSPRIEILGRVRGHLVSLDMPIVIRDMSLGGMSMETIVPFEVGSVHEFRLTLGDDSWLLLRGEVRHSRNIAPPGAAPCYQCGVQFVDDKPSAESPTTVAAIIEKIT